MPTQYIPNDVVIQGSLTVTGDKPHINQSDHVQRASQPYMIPWERWRVWNDINSILPNTGSTDDLLLIGGTFASATPSIQSYDLKAAGSTTLYGRTWFQLPPEYDTGQTVQFQARAGMLTTIADTAATLDISVYKSDKEAGVDGVDLYTGSAVDINNLSLADKDFDITATGLAQGDWLDIRIAMLINDASTVTVVKGILGYTAMLLDIKQ